MALRQLGRHTLLGQARPAGWALPQATAALQPAYLAAQGAQTPAEQPPCASCSGRAWLPQAGAGRAMPWGMQQHAGYAIDTTKRAYIPSRKPAIKSPRAHQWHFCDVEYDPMKPPPQNKLPPFAPKWAHTKDYAALLREQMPEHHTRKFRRGWNKNRVLATMRWRHSWQLRLARQEKWEATVQRTRERIHRDVAWQAWKDWRAAHQGQQGEQGQQALQQQGRPQPQGRPQQQSDAASFPPREPTLPAP